MWEVGVNGNLHFVDMNGLGYRFQGTTLTILDPVGSTSEPQTIENVRKVVLTDSEGHEIDPYDQ